METETETETETINVNSPEPSGSSRKKKYEQLISEDQTTDLINRWTDYDFQSECQIKDHFNDYDALLPIFMVDELVDYPYLGYDVGRPLLEVFSVLIQNHVGNLSRISGTIAAYREACPPLKIWDRPDSNPVSIGAHETIPLLLNGPCRKCFSADDPFGITVDLVDIFEEDTKVKIEGYLSCPLSSKRGDYDTHKSETIYLGNLSVQLNFVVYRWAVPANVEVLLMNDSTNVHGRITAWSTVLKGKEKDDCESVLFNTEKGEDVEIEKDEVVPLLRSRVAVPLNSNLKVWARLYDGDGKQIASGDADFRVIPFGISEDNIRGKHGEIHVKVTWKLYPVAAPNPPNSSGPSSH